MPAPADPNVVVIKALEAELAKTKARLEEIRSASIHLLHDGEWRRCPADILNALRTVKAEWGTAYWWKTHEAGKLISQWLETEEHASTTNAPAYDYALNSLVRIKACGVIVRVHRITTILSADGMKAEYGLTWGGTMAADKLSPVEVHPRTKLQIGDSVRIPGYEVDWAVEGYVFEGGVPLYIVNGLNRFPATKLRTTMGPPTEPFQAREVGPEDHYPRRQPIHQNTD